MYIKERWNGDSNLVRKRAGVSRSVSSRILSDNLQRVSKETAMKFAIGLALDRRDAELLLKSAGYSFSDSIPWDLAFEYCIEHGYGMKDVNKILVSCGCEPVRLD